MSPYRLTRPRTSIGGASATEVRGRWRRPWPRRGGRSRPRVVDASTAEAHERAEGGVELLAAGAVDRDAWQLEPGALASRREAAGARLALGRRLDHGHAVEAAP